MNLFPKSGLQRQLIFYTFFIGIIFLTMAIEMTIFLKGEKVLGVLNSAIPANLPKETVDLILLKVAVMLGNLLLGIGLVMLLFTKRIMFPLNRIIQGTRAMSHGDFSATLPYHIHNELGELSCNINDLAANYQELILFTGKTTEQTRYILRHGSDASRIDDAIKLQDELEETLQEFGRSFYQC